MILTLDAYKAYLPPNTLTDATKMSAFEFRALYKHLLRYLGQQLTDSVAGDDPDEELIQKIAPPLVNLAYLESIPFFNLVLMNTGFGIVSNQNVAPASMERIRDLKDACLQAANHGIDQLLAYLESGDDGLSGSGSIGEPFSLWNNCSLNDNSLIASATEFNTVSGLYVSRMQFVDLKETVNIIETTRFAEVLSTEFIADLIEGSDTLVKPLIRKSLALFAFSQYIPSSNEKSAGMYHKQAEALLRRAVSLLKSNLSSYPVYEQYGYEAPYDNDDFDDDDDSAFFVAGATA